MRRTLVSLVALGAFSASAWVRADAPAAPPIPQNQIQPSSPQPNMVPPAPVFANPPAPSAQPIEVHRQPPPPAPVAAMPAPAGQWVFTQQYGWLWMPYDQAYTHVEDNAALAYEYVYYPTYGWSWVVAPWVLGFGVLPYWGAMGVGHFAWYAHPWFRVGTAHLRPSWGRGAGLRSGFRFGGGRMGGGHGHR